MAPGGSYMTQQKHLSTVVSWWWNELMNSARSAAYMRLPTCLTRMFVPCNDISSKCSRDVDFELTPNFSVLSLLGLHIMLQLFRPAHTKSEKLETWDFCKRRPLPTDLVWRTLVFSCVEVIVADGNKTQTKVANSSYWACIIRIPINTYKIECSVIYTQ